jgi:hypothetical protein
MYIYTYIYIYIYIHIYIYIDGWVEEIREFINVMNLCMYVHSTYTHIYVYI